MAEGFLGRWSQRKQAVRAGVALDEPLIPKEPAAQPALTPEAETAQPPQPPAAPPLPTLADVQALTADSSFAPFVSRGVAPEVRNAAMKKLFTDPHFNVMDRLDIYIDDYSLADPIPAAMLRQMDSAKFLKLFDEEPTADATSNPTEDTPHHDHTDMRLQPDHAPGPPLARNGAGREPDTAFEPVPPPGS